MRTGSIIVVSVVCGVYALFAWLSSGHWPEMRTVILIAFGIWIVGAANDGLHGIGLAVSELAGDLEELKEKIEAMGETLEQLESTLDEIDRRIPGRKSLLDEF